RASCRAGATSRHGAPSSAPGSPGWRSAPTTARTWSSTSSRSRFPAMPRTASMTPTPASRSSTVAPTCCSRRIRWCTAGRCCTPSDPGTTRAQCYRPGGYDRLPGRLRWPLVVGGEGLEQLDQIAGRILDQDLPDAHPGDDVVAEACALAAQLADGARQVFDPQGDPVPAARPGQRAVRHRGTAARAAAGDAEQQPQVAPVEHGERGGGAKLLLEPQQIPVERARGVKIGDEVPHGGGLAGGGFLPPRHPPQHGGGELRPG